MERMQGRETGEESETEAATGKNHVWLPWNQQKPAGRKLMVWIPEQKIVGHLNAFKKKTSKNLELFALCSCTKNSDFKYKFLTLFKVFHPSDETVTLYISTPVFRSASVRDTHHLNF